MNGETLQLDSEWSVGERIGVGGFGEVYEVSGTSGSAAAKFIPKAPGADRELLFVDLSDAVNVVPIIDSGEHQDFWVLVMPRADESLRDYLDASGGSIDLTAMVKVLIDVVDALVSLEARVVHRDLKPENVLHVDGSWCLADFGISRYAEATTAPDTRKFAMSPPYAAPERWRHERASSAADVYAVGVMAFEMVSGERPFPGPAWEDFQEQHLHDIPPDLTGVPTRLVAAVEECLFKAPGARPSPSNLRARLGAALVEPSGTGLSGLIDANRDEIGRRAETDRRESERHSTEQTLAGLADAGRSVFDQLSSELLSSITTAATSATLDNSIRGGWRLSLGSSSLTVTEPQSHAAGDWGGWDPPSFDVILSAEINLKIPPGSSGYEGRSHSLWYCDAEAEGEFAWYETAFMISPMTQGSGRQSPFALNPGEESAKAVWSGMAEFQLAWPFTRLVIGDLDDFIDRWAGWLGSASQGLLGHPSRMPERDGSLESFRMS